MINDIPLSPTEDLETENDNKSLLDLINSSSKEKKNQSPVNKKSNVIDKELNHEINTNNIKNNNTNLINDKPPVDIINNQINNTNDSIYSTNDSDSINDGIVALSKGINSFGCESGSESDNDIEKKTIKVNEKEKIEDINQNINTEKENQNNNITPQESRPHEKKKKRRIFCSRWKTSTNIKKRREKRLSRELKNANKNNENKSNENRHTENRNENRNNKNGDNEKRFSLITSNVITLFSPHILCDECKNIVNNELLNENDNEKKAKRNSFPLTNKRKKNKRNSLPNTIVINEDNKNTKNKRKNENADKDNTHKAKKVKNNEKTNESNKNKKNDKEEKKEKSSKIDKTNRNEPIFGEIESNIVTGKLFSIVIKKVMTEFPSQFSEDIDFSKNVDLNEISNGDLLLHHLYRYLLGEKESQLMENEENDQSKKTRKKGKRVKFKKYEFSTILTPNETIENSEVF